MVGVLAAGDVGPRVWHATVGQHPQETDWKQATAPSWSGWYARVPISRKIRLGHQRKGNAQKWRLDFSNARGEHEKEDQNNVV